LDALQQFNDFLSVFGAFNINGNIYAAFLNDLRIQRSSGRTFDDGVNFRNNPLSPHVLSTPTEAPVSEIWYFHRDPGDPSGWNNNLPLATIIDPDNWDDGTGVLAAVPVGKFTIQLITFYAPWDVTDIQYGQVVYNTLAEAEEALLLAVDLNPWNSAWDTLRGWLIVGQGATDLSNAAQAKFVTASRFGMIQGQVGSTGVVLPHKDTHRSGGTDSFVSTDVLEAVVKRAQETSGPTVLTLGAVPDGSLLSRSGATLVGVGVPSHKDTHKSGGTDAFLLTDVLEAAVKRLQESGGPVTLTLGAVADGQLLQRSGTNIVGTALPSHKDTHKSGGTDAFTSADILEAAVKRLQESGGPTVLTLGAVTDGSLLRRVGTDIVGFSIPAFGQNYQTAISLARATYTGGTGFQNKTTLTTPALTGTYRVAWTAVLDGSSAAQNFEAQLYNTTDASIVGVVRIFRPANAAERTTVCGFAEVTFSGAAKTFNLRYRTVNAGQTVGIADARIEIWRTS
jgi:hypothetical protein